MKIINTPAFSVSISVDENGNIIDSKTSIMYNPIEQKQETLEEVALKLYPISSIPRKLFIRGAKWQQEQDKNKYSEEEVKELLYKLMNYNPLNKELDNWFENNKNK